jgi:hypothetical protein
MKNGSITTVLITRGAFADMYEPAWSRSLNELGLRCEVFDSHALTLPLIAGRVERRILSGPGIAKIRTELIRRVERDRPDVTLLYQGHYFDKETIERLRPNTFVVGYHNDDPFGSRKKMLRYRHLLPALSAYEGFHVYRPCNVEEALAHGAPRAALLMPYYLPWLDYPRSLSGEERKRWGCDLVFAGHVENDLRIGCLVGAVRAGMNVKVYGEEAYWRSALPRDVYEKLAPIGKVIGEDYRKALCAARIAVSFHSKWNRDRYTRRSFEIPACGAFLLSERTPEMQELFGEGSEAEYFSSPDEFLRKARRYLQQDEERARIATAGHRRVTSSGHDIHSRMRQWLGDVSRWRETRPE